MEGGAAERDALLRQQMKVMPPERFEQVVLELAQREYPGEVRRLKHPDGGADTLRPATTDRKAEVWQAKRYGDDINWEECEKSLTAAIKRWDPSKVTFVFARDLSQQLEGSFQTRLVEHAGAQRAGVAVLLWNQSEVVRRLDENPDLKPRFFGPEQESIYDALDRTIKAGGRLESGADLVERAHTLSKYAEQRDVDFAYAVTAASAQTPAPQWPELPYLQMELTGAGGRVQVAAWPREGAGVQLPSFSFTDDPAGQEARAEALRHWARGEEAEVTEGARVQFHVPDVIRELLPNPNAWHGGSLRIPPTQAFEAELEVASASETLSHRFEVRPVPPRPGAFGALVGYIGETLVEIGFALLDEQHSRATFTLSASFGPNVRASMEAARLLHAWCTHERLTFRSEELYPEGIGGRCEVPGEEVCAEMEWRARFYADVVFLEEQLGIELALPDEMKVEDRDVVGTAANILRTRERSATFRQVEGFVDNPADIPGLPERFRKQGAVRKMVTYMAFGRDLNLGEADYELPPLKAVDIIPHGHTPTAPARVVLAADGDDQMRFRLVKWKLPST